jgi:membrane-bound metal-dependent hydrolase YbcI (DUF457 family)
MLPVAHGLLAATSVAAFRGANSASNRSKELLLGAVLGIAPDFDYSLNYLGTFGGGWHHAFTHSLLFGCFIGCLVAVCIRPFKWKSALIYSLAIISHPLLDYCFTESRGIELLWPFTSTRYRLHLPNPIDYDWSNSSFSAATFDILKISLLEFMIFAPLFIFVFWLTGRTPGSTNAVRPQLPTSWRN